MLRLNVSTDLFNLTVEEVDAYTGMINTNTLYSNLYLQSLGYSPWIIRNLAPYTLIFLALSLSFILASTCSAAWKRKDFVPKLLIYLPLQVNTLTRFAYWSFLEVSVCVFLAIGIGYSLSELLVAILLLIFLIMGLLACMRLFCKKLLAPSLFEERTSLPRAIFCWEARFLKQEALNQDSIAQRRFFANMEARSNKVNPVDAIADDAEREKLRHEQSSLPPIHTRTSIKVGELFLPDNFEGGQEEGSVKLGPMPSKEPCALESED